MAGLRTGVKILRLMYALAMHCLLVVYLQTSAEGVIAGTLIATPSGLRTVDELSSGDPVLCYDAEQVHKQQTIAHIFKHISQNIIQLVVHNQTICVDGEQCFYLPLEKSWCKAYQLVPGHVLLATLSEEQADAACDRYCVIEDVQKVSGLYLVYDLTVPVYHNFCITTLGLLTHNAAVLAPIVATVGAKIMAFLGALAASTPIALTSAQATVAAAGTTIGIGASIICDTVKAKRATERLQQCQSKPLLYPKHQSDLHKSVPAQINNVSKKEPISVSTPITKPVAADAKTKSPQYPYNLRVALPKIQHASVRKINSHQHRVGTPRKIHPEHLRAQNTELKTVRNHRKACGTAQRIPSSTPAKTCSTAQQSNPTQDLVPSCGLISPAQPSTLQAPCYTKSPNNGPAACTQGVSQSNSATPSHCDELSMAAQTTVPLSKEVNLGSVKSTEEGLKKALELLEPVDPHTAVPRVGIQGPCKGKIDGTEWHDGKVTIRLDWDPQKGSHINVSDWRKGKTEGFKGYILLPGGQEAVEAFLGHLNSKANLEMAKQAFEGFAKDNPNAQEYLISINKQLENLK